MSLDRPCPICDARPGEKCYDPHGKLPYKDQHAERVSPTGRKPKWDGCPYAYSGALVEGDPPNRIIAIHLGIEESSDDAASIQP